MKNYPEMACLTLKKVWSDAVMDLYLKHQARYMPKSEVIYWSAVDAAIKFWARTLTDIIVK